MKNAGKINRRSFLRKIGIAGSLPLVAGAAPSFWKSDNKQVTGDLQKQHRNVLLLISDDHGIDQLGCYGNSKINTPNLDKMAGEGVRFT
ncbi:MAG: sulfatase-like hydrolase/transferase, partial [Candidatus Marinimicrobia bacterium]|nr:sulfatase-like hydrolase/transferase [Candidatus Neomarinimicrobiota bacterium]